MNKTVQQKVRRGTQITLTGTVANGVLQVAGLTILSKLLSPVDYGIYAISLSLNAITLQFVASAAERAILLLEDKEDAAQSFAPVILIMAAATIFPLVGFFLADRLGYIGLSLSVTCVLIFSQIVNAIAIVPRALLRRSIRFGRIVSGEFAGQLIGQLGVSIFLASQHFGSLSIAIGLLVSNVISTLFVVSTAPRILTTWRLGGLRTVWKLFRSIGTISGLEMLAGQSPPFLLGSVLGVVTVGLFNRANAIIGLPLQLITNSLSRVLISGFSINVRDEIALRRSFLGQLRMSTVICFPLAAGIAGSSGAFTEVVLGAKWLAARPMILPIALFSSASLMCVLTGTLADAAHRFRSKMMIQIIDNVAAVIAIVVFARISALVALYALAGTAVMRLALSLNLSRQITNCDWFTVVRSLMPAIVASVSVFVAAELVGWLLADYDSYFILVFQILACAVAQMSALLLVDRNLVRELLEQLTVGQKSEGVA